ncbi:hypothetical protein [Bradyrhizobium iriomotense]|uniref:hypothetical protein n=1 Tax=Bradyrhizobium iriomotense TaxID=441950 RepID=UPI001FEDA5EC|nr:hypothetical protein [Bradyrhizobium iriomotense]
MQRFDVASHAIALPPFSQNSNDDVCFVPVWMQLLSFVECSARIEHALAHFSPEFTCVPKLKAQLYVALGFALLNTTGSADRMKAALSIGLALAEELSDLELQLKAVWTLWSYNLNSGQYAEAKEVGERYLEIALRTGNPANETVGRRLIGAATHFFGAQEDARRELTLSLDHAAHGLDGGANQMWFLLNQSVLAKAMLARVLLLQGKIGQSRSLAAECLQEAEREKDKLAIAYALRNAVCPRPMTRPISREPKCCSPRDYPWPETSIAASTS